MQYITYATNDLVDIIKPIKAMHTLIETHLKKYCVFLVDDYSYNLDKLKNELININSKFSSIDIYHLVLQSNKLTVFIFNTFKYEFIYSKAKSISIDSDLAGYIGFLTEIVS